MSVTAQTPAPIINVQSMDSNLINAPPVKPVMVPSRPRGRPKKVLADDDVIASELLKLEKNQKKVHKELVKAEKADEVTPSKPLGRPKKVRTPEELAVIAQELEAKEQRKVDRAAKKAAKEAEKAAKAFAMRQKRVEILAKRTVALDEYEAKWSLTYTGNN